MPKLLPILILLLGCTLAGAQTLSPIELSEARRALAYEPHNDAKRLLLAWNLMFLEEYEDALAEYRFVAQRDSSSLDAAAGILWALNSQGKYSQVIAEADAFLERMPLSGPLFYHRSLAWLNLGKATKARLDAILALDNMEDPYWRELAAKALSDAYLALDDLPSAQAVIKIHAPDAEKPKGYKGLVIDATWGNKAGNTYIFGAGVKATLGATRFGLHAEELTLDAAHFRWYLHASLLQQFRHLDLQAQVRFLDGEDTRIYPARGASLSLIPRIYAGPVIIRPQFTQSALLTARLNSYQSDLALGLSLAPYTLGYSLSRVYLDTDIVGSDSSAWVHSAEFRVTLGKGYELGIYGGGGGSMAFYSTPYGGLIDDFDPPDGFAGLSFYAPFTRHLGLLCYGQYSFDADGGTTFFYLRGSYRV